jgi:glycerol-3-phosphate O-acyltransferase
MPIKEGNLILRCVISKEDMDLLLGLHPSRKPSLCLKQLLRTAAEHNQFLATKEVARNRALKKRLREQVLAMADTLNELGERE